MKCEKFRSKYWMDLQHASGNMKGEKFRNKYWMDLQLTSGSIAPKVRVIQHGPLSSRIQALLSRINGTTR